MNRTILVHHVRLGLISDIYRASTTSTGEFLPVDAGNDMIHSEGRVVVIILPPDLASWPDAIVGAVERVVERDDDGEKPGGDGQDLIRDDRVLGVGFALGERVDYEWAQKQLAKVTQSLLFPALRPGEYGESNE